MAQDEQRVGGRYRLDRMLASGGMGTVWLAWDEMLHRRVAVKRMHLQPGLSEADRQTAVGRAMREARLAGRFQHPNAVQVYDVVDESTGPCLVMEYVPSRSLAEIVRTDGPLPPDNAARIGTQLAAALAAAHRAGIVHRDVKPGNVLVADDGTVRITDFGVSHALDDVSVTSTGMVSGTPAYLAPEVARGEASSFASDVWSLGATLYLAVEGRAPFGDDGNPMAVLHRVASGAPAAPVRSGRLTPMLNAMMAADASARPSMVDIAGRLPEVHPLTDDASPEPPADAPTQVLPRQVGTLPPAESTVSTRVPARPAPAPAPPPVEPPVVPFDAPAPEPRRDGRRFWIPIAAAVLVIALGVVLAVVLLRDVNGPDVSADRTPPASATAPNTQAETVSAPPPSSVPSSSSTAPTSTTPTTSSSKPKPTPSSTKPTTPTADELRAALVRYFSVIPNDLDAGWNLLTPRFQQSRAQGRGVYNQYWGTVRRVDVANARGDAPRTATAQLTYRYKSGKVVRTNARLTFVREDGVLKINGQN